MFAILSNTFRVTSSKGVREQSARINHGPSSALELSTPVDDRTVPVIFPTCQFFLDRQRSEEVCSVIVNLRKRVAASVRGITGVP